MACAAPRWRDQPLASGSFTAEPSSEPASAEPGRELPNHELASNELASSEPSSDSNAELQQLLAQVSALRGLSPPPRVLLIELPAQQLAQAALAHAARDWPEPARRAQAELLWRLGLVPAGADLLALLSPLLEAQLEAFYAWAEGAPALYVRQGLSGRARRRALAHELVHALQDHEHGLLRRLADERLSSDQRSVLHALAEADALAVVERLGLAAGLGGEELHGQGGASEPARVPAVLLRSLAAPYRDGRALVERALNTGGFAAVDRWLRQPPPSSHALLRPALAAVAAAPLSDFPTPGPGWRRSHGDVLGEQSLRLVLEEWGGAAAERAAAWQADRLSTFQSPGASALAWQVELADLEYAAALQQLLLPSLRPDPVERTALRGPEWTCEAHSDAGVVATARSGRRVVFASLTPGAQIVSAAAQCATLEAWVAAANFAVRPGSGEPHRSRRTPLEGSLPAQR